MSTPYTSELSHQDWLAAKVVIEKFLRDLMPSSTPQNLDHNSSALIARLCHANPVLHVVRADCIAWADNS